MFGFHLTVVLVGLTTTDAALLFVQEPKAELYYQEGSNAVFSWDYKVDNRTAELNYISWEIFNKTTRVFDILLFELSDGSVQYNSKVPPAFGSQRVKKEGRATLVIKNVTFEDSVEFRCVLSGISVADVRSTVTLIVSGFAFVDHPVQPGKVGEHASFTCNATNVPSQNITWMRAEQNYSRIVVDNKYEVISSGSGFSQLTIKDISISDHGFYVCDATVNVNQPSSARGFLGVVSLSRSFDSCPSTNQIASKDVSTTICCPVRGFPPPEITWKFPDGTKQKTGNTILPITPRKEDFGTYTCSALGLKETDPDPLVISINLQEEEPRNLTAKNNTSLRDGEKFEWIGVNNSLSYICRIRGEAIEETSLVVDHPATSIEIPYRSLKFKNKEQNPAKVLIDIVAIGESEVIGTGGPFTVEISAAASLGLPFILGVVLFMPALTLQ